MSRGNTKSATCVENFQSIIENDLLNPFVTDHLCPCVIVPDYTCCKCNYSFSNPIVVKNGPHLALYCPHCKSFIKNVNKKEKKFL